MRWWILIGGSREISHYFSVKPMSGILQQHWYFFFTFSHSFYKKIHIENIIFSHMHASLNYIYYVQQSILGRFDVLGI